MRLFVYSYQLASSSVLFLQDLTPNPQAKAQLDLLSKLISGGSSAAAERRSSKPEFRLNLFQTDEEEE